MQVTITIMAETDDESVISDAISIIEPMMAYMFDNVIVSSDIGDDDEPHCDICGEPELCSRKGCTICPNNWNSETGNHISCEEQW